MARPLGFTKNRPAAQRPGSPAARGGPAAQRPGGPRPMMARRPGPDFPPFFCPAFNPCACTGLYRVWACNDGEFEFVYIIILNNHFDPFIRSIACCYVKSVFILCLFVRLQNPKERKSILNDVSYFQTTV